LRLFKCYAYKYKEPKTIDQQTTEVVNYLENNTSTKHVTTDKLHNEFSLIHWQQSESVQSQRWDSGSGFGACRGVESSR